MQGRHNISHMPFIRGKLPCLQCNQGVWRREGRGERGKVRTVCPFMAA